MTTRFNSKSVTRFGVAGIESGYDNVSSSELSIPVCGIEDVDKALFQLFDSEIQFQVTVSDNQHSQLKKVPVIFAAAEKWALAKRKRALRDHNGSIILPLITVVRTSIQQTSDGDITGRGINQQTGEIVIRRRLDKSDRSYQAIINRLLIKNQTNVSAVSADGSVQQLTTSRTLGDLTDDSVINDGGLLLADHTNNVYETVTIPSPQFFSATYEITFWTQYTVQMLQMIERLIASFLPQGNAWRLDTPKGYWFIANISDNTYNSDNNTDDMSLEERILKHKFTVQVPAYILAPKIPGVLTVPIKRHVSVPTITFDVGVGSITETSQADNIDSPFLGSDDPTLPTSLMVNKRQDQRETGSTRLFPNQSVASQEDPALSTLARGRKMPQYKKITGVNQYGKTVSKLVRIASTNRSAGETVYAPDSELGGLSIILTED